MALHLLSEPVAERARRLLGDRQHHPSVDDLRRIEPEMLEAFTDVAIAFAYRVLVLHEVVAVTTELEAA